MCVRRIIVTGGTSGPFYVCRQVRQKVECAGGATVVIGRDGRLIPVRNPLDRRHIHSADHCSHNPWVGG